MLRTTIISNQFENENTKVSDTMRAKQSCFPSNSEE